MVNLSIDNSTLIDYVASRRKPMTFKNIGFNISRFNKSYGSILKREIIDDKFVVNVYTLSSGVVYFEKLLLQKTNNRSVLTARTEDNSGPDFNEMQRELSVLFKKWGTRTSRGEVSSASLYDKYRQQFYFELKIVNESLLFYKIGCDKEGYPIYSPVLDMKTGELVILGGRNK